MTVNRDLELWRHQLAMMEAMHAGNGADIVFLTVISVLALVGFGFGAGWMMASLS
jgi:hypothetical protein